MQSPLHPVGSSSVDGEAAEGPDQESGNDNPLREAKNDGYSPANARLCGGDDGDGRVDKVEGGEGETVGQSTIPTADIKGDGYGEDYAQQEDGTGDDSEEPPHRRDELACWSRADRGVCF